MASFVRKKKHWWQIVAVWASALWAASAWLVVRSELIAGLDLSKPVSAMEVRAQEQADQVILPAKSVIQSDEQAYVLVVENDRARRLAVEATSWREDYWSVSGLPEMSVVILTEMVVPGELVSYHLINPEAGVSGQINR